MTDKQHTYSNQVVKIADYIFTNPEKNREAVLAHFGTLWHKSRRTLNRYITQAKEYNKTRIHKQEKAKDEVLVAEAKESIKNAILSREEGLEIWTSIARGNARQVKRNNQILVPSDNERGKMVDYIFKAYGWYAPEKTAQTDSKGNDIVKLTSQEIAEFIIEMEKDYGKE